MLRGQLWKTNEMREYGMSDAPTYYILFCISLNKCFRDLAVEINCGGRDEETARCHAQGSCSPY